MAKYCKCCHLPIFRNSDDYCHRSVCLDVRMAEEQRKLISQSGKFLVQWETLDAQIKMERFDDENKARHFFTDIYPHSVSAFIQYPDGSVLE